jgi:hypothetical protein
MNICNKHIKNEKFEDWKKNKCGFLFIDNTIIVLFTPLSTCISLRKHRRFEELWMAKNK